MCKSEATLSQEIISMGMSFCSFDGNDRLSQVSIPLFPNIFFYFSELRVSREHDAAVNKLMDWLARFKSKLDHVFKESRNFYTKERLSEARAYLEQLNELKAEVDKLIAEVRFGLNSFAR